jgi:hypothetical protein
MLPDDPEELLERLMEREVAVAELKTANKLLKGRLADKDATLAAKEAELQARLAMAHMKWQQENMAFARTNAKLMLRQGTHTLYATRRTVGGWDPASDDA